MFVNVWGVSCLVFLSFDPSICMTTFCILTMLGFDTQKNTWLEPVEIWVAPPLKLRKDAQYMCWKLKSSCIYIKVKVFPFGMSPHVSFSGKSLRCGAKWPLFFQFVSWKKKQSFFQRRGYCFSSYSVAKHTQLGGIIRLYQVHAIKGSKRVGVVLWCRHTRLEKIEAIHSNHLGSKIKKLYPPSNEQSICHEAV